MNRVKTRGSAGVSGQTRPTRTSRPASWKLFFVMDEAEIEADFVVARTASAAKKAFSTMYGGEIRSTAELVTEVATAPPWLQGSTWLGPDNDVLEELGGKRVPSLDFPRWQFGDRVWGYPKTAQRRYSFLSKGELHMPPPAVAQRERPDRAGEPAPAAEPSFEEMFGPTFRDAFELRVTLLEIFPAIWRRVRVPAYVSLADLHDVLQIAFGWQDYHLHDFEVQGLRFANPDIADELWAIDERAAPLGAVARKGALFEYRYDYGDGWEHEVLVERVVPGGDTVLSCIGGERACPPEDCGGPDGYARLCQALANPRDPEHQELRRWAGRFNAETFDVAAVNRKLAKLGKRMSAPFDRPSGMGPAR